MNLVFAAVQNIFPFMKIDLQTVVLALVFITCVMIAKDWILTALHLTAADNFRRVEERKAESSSAGLSLQARQLQDRRTRRQLGSIEVSSLEMDDRTGIGHSSRNGTLYDESLDHIDVAELQLESDDFESSRNDHLGDLTDLQMEHNEDKLS